MESHNSSSRSSPSVNSSGRRRDRSPTQVDLTERSPKSPRLGHNPCPVPPPLPPQPNLVIQQVEPIVITIPSSSDEDEDHPPIGVAAEPTQEKDGTEEEEDGTEEEEDDTEEEEDEEEEECDHADAFDRDYVRYRSDTDEDDDEDEDVCMAPDFSSDSDSPTGGSSCATDSSVDDWYL